MLEIDPKWLAPKSDSERPSLDNYGEFFRFGVDSAPAPTEAKAEGQEKKRSRSAALEPDPVYPDVAGSVGIVFLVGQKWLLTIHDGAVPSLLRFRNQDKVETSIGLLTPQTLAASLLDWHLGEYFQEVSRIEAAVDRLDERVLRETATKTLLGRIVSLRRRVSKLQALLVAQRDIFYGLSRPDFALITDSGASPYYEALAGRFERALDEVERTRDVVVGSFDLFTSRTAQQTNDLVKLLTFITAVIGFCAAAAGLMGMNFQVSLFESGYLGFGIVTGGLLLSALIAIVIARRRGWI